MGNQVFGDDIDVVYDTERYSAGSRRRQLPDEVESGSPAASGEREWLFVNNVTGVAWTKGAVIYRQPAGLYYGTVTGSAVNAWTLLGVAQHAVAAGKWAWVLTRGEGEVAGGGSVTVGSVVVSGANGRAVNMAGGGEHNAFAVALENDGSAGDLFSAYIGIP